ncbi:MAG: oligosaccharide flippase family protein [Marinilabiliaceae bacterium]|nr:oligosaccharide flippase family protein [Marinilabiliaceae bacterium]
MFSKVKSTAKNSMFYSIGNLAGKMSGVILLPLYTTFLSAEMFGLFALFEVTYLLIQAFTGMGVKAALMRWYWDKEMEDRRKELFFSSFVFNFIVSVITLIILFVGFGLIATYFFKTEVSMSLQVVFLLSTFVRLIVDMPMLLLRITHQAALHTRHQLIQLAVFVGVVVLMLMYFRLDILGIFIGYLVANTLNLLMLLPFIQRNIKWNYQHGVIRDMLRFGFPLALSNLMNLVLSMSDKVIINLFSTLKNVGNYTLAYKISNIVELMVVNAFMNAYTHVFFKGMDETGNERFFAKTFTYFIFTLTFISLGLVLFVGEVVKVLSFNNQDYVDSIALIPVLTLSIVFGGARCMLVLPLQRHKKTRVISVVSVCIGLSNLGLNILLVPIFGSMGAAVATLFTQMASSIWLLRYASRLDKTPYETRKLALMLGAAVALANIGIWFPLDVWLIKFLLNCVLLVSWFIILYFSNFFEPVELERIRQGWEKWRRPGQWLANIKKERSAHESVAE